MHSVLMYVIPIIAISIFVLTFVFMVVFMFSPKARGKFLSNQVKSMKYMMDDSKDDIENISTNMADASKDGIEITTRAIKKGFTDEEGIRCKYCGKIIDKESKYCKYCGKEQ